MLIEFKHNGEEIQRELERLARDKLPDAMALAITRTAIKAKDEIRSEMQRVFDRPTPYTLDSMRVLAARKAVPIAKLMIKDQSLKARPASKWLTPQVFGGERNLKGFEVKLRRAGVLGPNQWVMPGEAARYDQYGNVTRGQLVAMLSDVQAWTSEDIVKNSTLKTRGQRERRNLKKGRRGGVYFAITTRRGRLRPGIYERASFAFGSAARPVMVFVDKRPIYRKLLPYEETAQRVMRDHFRDELADSVRYVVGKAIDRRATA